mmetsp:Transcript_31495/g.71560  ORF Transcript_31495/g.71560 Transcript_31495/m.71560 type:complete len:107 (+) Transcript_31495:68-388(+)
MHGIKQQQTLCSLLWSTAFSPGSFQTEEPDVDAMAGLPCDRLIECWDAAAFQAVLARRAWDPRTQGQVRAVHGVACLHYLPMRGPEGMLLSWGAAATPIMPMAMYL